MLTKLLTDLYIISLLDDEPNDVGGMSSAELKAKFDEAGNTIKDYINNTLIPELAGNGGAESVGIDTVPGLTGVSTVQAAFAKIEEQMADMTQGAVADESITTAKLAALAVTSAKLAAAAVETAKIKDEAVTTPKLAAFAVTAARLADLAVETAKIKDKAVTTEKIADKAVTTAQLGDASVGTAQLDALSVTAAKLAALAVETAKIKDGAVTRAKLAQDALYSPNVMMGATEVRTLVGSDVGTTFIGNSSVDYVVTVNKADTIPIGAEFAFFLMYGGSIKIKFGSTVKVGIAGNDLTAGLTVVVSEKFAMVAIKKIETYGGYDTYIVTGPAEVVS
nr:MAG TPA: hypothetical protein [Caudoviricetes sp.]